jgi:hypothetical protein
MPTNHQAHSISSTCPATIASYLVFCLSSPRPHPRLLRRIGYKSHRYNPFFVSELGPPVPWDGLKPWAFQGIQRLKYHHQLSEEESGEEREKESGGRRKRERIWVHGGSMPAKTFTCDSTYRF